MWKTLMSKNNNLFAITINLHTVILFQVFLSNAYNFNRFIWPMGGFLTDSTAPGQSGFGSNSNKWVTRHPIDL